MRSNLFELIFVLLFIAVPTKAQSNKTAYYTGKCGLTVCVPYTCHVEEDKEDFLVLSTSDKEYCFIAIPFIPSQETEEDASSIMAKLSSIFPIDSETIEKKDIETISGTEVIFLVADSADGNASVDWGAIYSLDDDLDYAFYFCFYNSDNYLNYVLPTLHKTKITLYSL